MIDSIDKDTHGIMGCWVSIGSDHPPDKRPVVSFTCHVTMDDKTGGFTGVIYEGAGIIPIKIKGKVTNPKGTIKYLEFDTQEPEIEPKKKSRHTPAPESRHFEFNLKSGWLIGRVKEGNRDLPVYCYCLFKRFTLKKRRSTHRPKRRSIPIRIRQLEESKIV